MYFVGWMADLHYDYFMAQVSVRIRARVPLVLSGVDAVARTVREGPAVPGSARNGVMVEAEHGVFEPACGQKHSEPCNRKWQNSAQWLKIMPVVKGE